MAQDSNGENPNAWVLSFVILLIFAAIAAVIYGIYKMSEWLWTYTRNPYVVISWVGINLSYWGYWFHLNFHLLPPKSAWSGGSFMPFYIIAVIVYVIILLFAIADPKNKATATTSNNDQEDDDYPEDDDHPEEDDSHAEKLNTAVKIAAIGYGIKKSYDIGRKLGK